MPCPQNDETGLIFEALAALRELAVLSDEAHDRSADDGYSTSTWQSDELSAAVKRANAVLAKAEAIGFKPEARDSSARS